MTDASRRGGATLAGRAESIDPHACVTSKLRALYQAVENEPLPQQLIDLLRRLDEAETAR